MLVVACHDLGRGPGAAHELSALAYAKLNIVYLRAEWDAAERHGVAYLDLGLVARHDCVAYPQVDRREDISLLAVRVVYQSDASRPVGVVLDSRDLARHVKFV